MMEHLFNFHEFSYIQKNTDQRVPVNDPVELNSCPEETEDLNSFSLSKASARERATNFQVGSILNTRDSFIKKKKKSREYNCIIFNGGSIIDLIC